MSEINNKNSLGKGEVVSSILTGSTTEALQNGAFLHLLTAVHVVSLQNTARTPRVNSCKIGAP